VTGRAATVAAVVAGCALGCVLIATDRPTVVVLPLVAALIAIAPGRSALERQLALAVAAGLVVAHVYGLGQIMARNLVRVPEWDFTAFWLHARLAAQGVDFYDREKVRELTSALHLSPTFQLQGRFWNPPQAMLLFLPLGWVDDVRRAYLGWYVVQSLALVGCVGMLWRLLARSTGMTGLLATAAVTTTLAATAITFYLGQTHFLVLLLLLLSFSHRDRFAGGVWLALGLLLRPILLLMLVEPVLRRRWPPLLGLAATAVVTTIGALAAFGVDVMTGYLSHGAGPVPPRMYGMAVNQSLLAVLVRAGLLSPEGTPPADPVYLAIVVAAVLATVFAVWRWHGRAPNPLLALLVCVALIIYPQTLDHYAVMLLPALLVLWCSRTLAGSALAAAAVILIGVHGHLRTLGLVFVAILVCTAGVVWRCLVESANVPGNPVGDATGPPKRPAKRGSWGAGGRPASATDIDGVAVV